MKRLWMILLTLSFVAGFVVAASTSNEPYRLGPGDVLTIGVWGHPDLQGDIRIMPDGDIVFPLLGSVRLADLTLAEAQQKLQTELAVFIRDPQVSMTVKEMRAIEVKVLGEVVRPGIYKIRPGSTLMDGIAIAGGPARRAELRNVGIFGPSQSEPRMIIAAGKRNRLYKGMTNEVPELFDGDTVYIPETYNPNWLLIFSYINGLNNLKDLVQD